MTERERIKQKYNGLCAYSGTPLEDDWQIEHIKPVRRNWDGTSRYPEDDCEENKVPVQKIINHYKHSMSLHEFKTWLLAGLHERLKRLPKNPRTEKSRKRKEYLLKVASYFDITPDKPFCGELYFEKVDKIKTV